MAIRQGYFALALVFPIGLPEHQLCSLIDFNFHLYFVQFPPPLQVNVSNKVSGSFCCRVNFGYEV